MIPIFEKTGAMAIGSRLRMLSDRITQDSIKIYESYEVGLKPKWFPVFYSLTQSGAKAVTDIAQEIGHSHPSVIKIVKEMVEEGMVSQGKDENDGRRNIISLTAKGRKVDKNISKQYLDVTKALENTIAKSQYNLWEAINEFEFLLDQKSLFMRVLEEKKERESDKIQIVDFEEKYAKAFKELNEEWIKHYFEMEEMDHKALDNPKEYILDKGGEILVALYEGKPVGVCALIPIPHLPYDFEMAKMGVSPSARGKGIGGLLGKAIVSKAKELGAKTLYLESNTKLTPAINLYQKLGFEKAQCGTTPYERCNIQMVLEL